MLRIEDACARFTFDNSATSAGRSISQPGLSWNSHAKSNARKEIPMRNFLFEPSGPSELNDGLARHDSSVAILNEWLSAEYRNTRRKPKSEAKPTAGRKRHSKRVPFLPATSLDRFGR